MIKRRVISTVAAFICVVSVFATNAVPAYAYCATAYTATYAEDDQPVARYEQTEWRLRVNNGRLEKRLWSLTYGYWKTEWEPVVPD
ncbi:MAG: hypothetical protein K2O45_00845 [Oscillospiraceae bacterium]|nr:hypothetical protein [Oscillospiraceae bacterium]